MVDSVAGVHMGSAFDRGVGRGGLRRDRDNLAVRSDDPLSSFFMESASLVVCRRRIARFHRGRDSMLDLARYLRGEALRSLLRLLPLGLVNQDMIAVDGDPVVAGSVALLA